MSANCAGPAEAPDTKKHRVEIDVSKDADPAPVFPSPLTDAAAYEHEYVHNVYSAIAEHFSSTRYKAWPQVSTFLEGLPPFSLVADVGCGNGKYFSAAQRLAFTPLSHTMGTPGATLEMKLKQQAEAQPSLPLVSSVPAHRYVVGLDYSEELLRSTQRQLVDPNLHQEKRCRRLHGKGARNEGEGVATPVSEVKLPRTDTVRSDALRCPLRDGVFDAAISIAVIHHYASRERRRLAVRELIRLIRPHGGLALIYVWAREQRENTKRLVNPETGDGLVRWERSGKYDSAQQVFQRYYHFFEEGELEQLCKEAVSDDGTGRIPIAIRKSYYDKENWCVMLERC
ncbi:putative Methyltransferase domain containing protein [Leishmania utingensis]|uniref:Methyltransferase domain containing protein n=1 Tax=Leishmania utingensis TaxID=653362 RepID=A0AAW2ZU78_9TRYP